jgi:hypothetical protein
MRNERQITIETRMAKHMMNIIKTKKSFLNWFHENQRDGTRISNFISHNCDMNRSKHEKKHQRSERCQKIKKARPSCTFEVISDDICTRTIHAGRRKWIFDQFFPKPAVSNYFIIIWIQVIINQKKPQNHLISSTNGIHVSYPTFSITMIFWE